MFAAKEYLNIVGVTKAGVVLVDRKTCKQDFFAGKLVRGKNKTGQEG